MIRQGRREHSSMLLHGYHKRCWKGKFSSSEFYKKSKDRESVACHLQMHCINIPQFIIFQEAIGVIDPDNEVDLMVLQCIYLLVSTTH